VDGFSHDGSREAEKKKRAPPDEDGFNHQMYIVRVFDQLIYNTDRNLQNLLITSGLDDLG
jgi:hypothetical protein